MALKAPGIVIFMVSVILVVLALVGRFFGAIPFLIEADQQFWAVVAAHVALVFGCIMRGL